MICSHWCGVQISFRLSSLKHLFIADVTAIAQRSSAIFPSAWNKLAPAEFGQPMAPTCAVIYQPMLAMHSVGDRALRGFDGKLRTGNRISTVNPALDQLNTGIQEWFVVHQIYSRMQVLERKIQSRRLFGIRCGQQQQWRDHQKSKLHWPKEESTCMIFGKLAGIGQSYSPFVGAHVISSEFSARAVAASQPMRRLPSPTLTLTHWTNSNGETNTSVHSPTFSFE